MQATGGGEAISKPLTDLEQRILNLISAIVIEGILDIGEPGIIEDEEQRTTDNQEEITNVLYVVQNIAETEVAEHTVDVTENVHVITPQLYQRKSKSIAKKHQKRKQIKGINKMSSSNVSYLVRSNNNIARSINNVAKSLDNVARSIKVLCRAKHE